MLENNVGIGAMQLGIERYLATTNPGSKILIFPSDARTHHVSSPIFLFVYFLEYVYTYADKYMYMANLYIYLPIQSIYHSIHICISPLYVFTSVFLRHNV